MLEVNEKLKRLNDNLKNLTKYGIGQNEIGIWIGYKKGKTTAISQPTISRWLKNDTPEQVEELLEYTSSLLKDLKRPLGQREWDGLQRGKIGREIISWPTVVDRFTSLEIQKFIANKSENDQLEVEAIGMKLKSLLTVFQSFLNKGTLPECKIKCIVIDPRDVGMTFRGIIEGERNDYKLNIIAGIYSWKDFKEALINTATIKNSTLDIRFLKPDPNFYMIKIYDKMLVSVYLRDIGNTNHYEIIDEKEEPKKFSDYYNLYLKYYSHDGLSSTIDLDKVDFMKHINF